MNTFFTGQILFIYMFMFPLTYMPIMRELSKNHVLQTYKSEITDFSVAPNPTQGYVTLKCKALAGKESFMAVSDISGRTVLERYMKEFPETGKIIIDLTGFSTGMYIVNIQAGQLGLFTKIVRI